MWSLAQPGRASPFLPVEHLTGSLTAIRLKTSGWHWLSGWKKLRNLRSQVVSGQPSAAGSKSSSADQGQGISPVVLLALPQEPEGQGCLVELRGVTSAKVILPRSKEVLR